MLIYIRNIIQKEMIKFNDFNIILFLINNIFITKIIYVP